MSYSVICPSCKEKNAGNAFHCVKCNADLVGVPRHEDAPSFSDSAFQRRGGAQRPAVSPALPKPESFGHALWRHLQASLMVFFFVVLCTALICFLANWRTLPDFGIGLMFAGLVLILSSVAGLFSSRYAWFHATPDTPSERTGQSWGNSVENWNTDWSMHGTPSERVRQAWNDHMEGLNDALVIVAAAVWCIGFGWVIISVVH